MIRNWNYSERVNHDSVGTLRCILDRETNPLALIQIPEALSLNAGVVNEDILLIISIRGDEPIAFAPAEPLDDARALHGYFVPPAMLDELGQGLSWLREATKKSPGLTFSTGDWRTSPSSRSRCGTRIYEPDGTITGRKVQVITSVVTMSRHRWDEPPAH